MTLIILGIIPKHDVDHTFGYSFALALVFVCLSGFAQHYIADRYKKIIECLYGYGFLFIVAALFYYVSPAYTFGASAGIILGGIIVNFMDRDKLF